MTTSELHVKKLIWAYMIESGRLTTGEWGYYSAGWSYPESMGSYGAPLKTYNDRIADMMSSISQHGVNWDRTSTPTSNQQTCFEGTYTASSTVETLLGTLVLNDGSQYLIGVGDSEVRFNDYVRQLMELQHDESRVKRIFGE